MFSNMFTLCLHKFPEYSFIIIIIIIIIIIVIIIIIITITHSEYNTKK
jgi:hypothetical protein